MRFLPLLHQHQLDEGQLYRVRAEGRHFLLTRQQGQVRIFDAHCPHAGYLLGPDDSDSETTVRCPRHGFRFELQQGRSLNQPGCALMDFPVAYEGSALGIWVN